jgi:hypothetical protein
LRPRDEHDLGALRDLLSDDEIDAINAVLEEPGYKYFLKFADKVTHSLARLQLLIGLEFGTVSQQVRQAVLDEMGSRGWVCVRGQDNRCEIGDS